MEISNIPQRTKVAVSSSDVKPNDIIYLNTKENAPSYLVLDACPPFVMLENMTTHFCNLYRITNNVYKEQ